jgi:hypothetical protein
MILRQAQDKLGAISEIKEIGLIFPVILSGVRSTRTAHDACRTNGVEGSLVLHEILRLRKNSAIAPFLLHSE